MVNDLWKILEENRHLVVELSIVNRGRAPAVFTPWAILRLFGAQIAKIPEIQLVRTSQLWKPDDPVHARAQEDILRKINDPLQEENRGFVVEGGSAHKITYQSIESVEQIETRIPNIRDILQLELFMSQVAVKRADVHAGKKSWILSSKGKFGRHGEQFPEDELALVRGKWR